MSSSPDSLNFKKNNFDLLRLLAAMQVAFVHGVEHFSINMPEPIMLMVKAFPGVPIFFVISGFLISAAFERSPSLSIYITNRILRIYPALWACLAVSIIVVALSHNVNTTFFDALTWLGAQLTIGQFYNPDFLRGFGVGVLNGSLWTIPVELQFYLALPFLYWLIRELKISNIGLGVLIMLLAIFNQFFYLDLKPQETVFSKLLGVSLLPHLYMFLLGVFLQKNRDLVQRLLVDRACSWLITLIVASSVFMYAGITFQGNTINPISSSILSLLTISLAYTQTDKFSNILRGNDISYGVYIYHMVFTNLIIQTQFTKGPMALFVMFLVTLIAASLSWKLVEYPALRRKKSSIYRLHK